jgi:DNA-binding GntR family transcriptional regulator
MTNGHHRDDVASLTEKAYQAISSAIARLELKPGESLTQDRLARWLSISRTPVREALRRLEQDGIIQTAPGRGLVVTELTIKDAEDLLEMLALLDTHAAFLAAQRRSQEQAARLVEIAQALLVAAEQNDLDAWEEIDHPYHETLLDASGNLFLRRAIEDVRRRLQRVTYHLAVQPEHLLSGTHDHVALAQAIYDRKAEAAAEIMRQHLETMHTMAMRLIRTHIVPVRGERF